MISIQSSFKVVDMKLNRDAHGQLGFHTQFNGVITDVDSRSNAWKAGLRKGCSLLEVHRNVNYEIFAHPGLLCRFPAVT